MPIAHCPAAANGYPDGKVPGSAKIDAAKPSVWKFRFRVRNLVNPQAPAPGGTALLTENTESDTEEQRGMQQCNSVVHYGGYMAP